MIYIILLKSLKPRIRSRYSRRIFPHLSIYLSISIYKFGLSVWVSVCLYPINVKSIGPIFFVGHHVTTEKVYE